MLDDASTATYVLPGSEHRTNVRWLIVAMLFLVTAVNYADRATLSITGSAMRSEFGLRTDRSFAVEDGVFTLRGRMAWAHDYNSDRNVGATFQALPGASFVVNGARGADDAALLTAAAEKKWLNGWSVAATFEGEFSRVSTSYTGKGALRYSW